MLGVRREGDRELADGQERESERQGGGSERERLGSYSDQCNQDVRRETSI